MCNRGISNCQMPTPCIYICVLLFTSSNCILFLRILSYQYSMPETHIVTLQISSSLLSYLFLLYSDSWLSLARIITRTDRSKKKSGPIHARYISCLTTSSTRKLVFVIRCSNSSFPSPLISLLILSIYGQLSY